MTHVVQRIPSLTQELGLSARLCRTDHLTSPCSISLCCLSSGRVELFPAPTLSASLRTGLPGCTLSPTGLAWRKARSPAPRALRCHFVKGNKSTSSQLHPQTHGLARASTSAAVTLAWRWPCALRPIDLGHKKAQLSLVHTFVMEHSLHPDPSTLASLLFCPLSLPLLCSFSLANLHKCKFKCSPAAVSCRIGVGKVWVPG